MLAVVALIFAAGGARFSLDPAGGLTAIVSGAWAFAWVAVLEEVLFRGFVFQRLVDGIGAPIAQLLMAQEKWTEAMDELLEILMRDKAWNGELARKTYVAILQIMTKPQSAAAAAKADAAAAAKKGTLEIAGKALAAPTDPLTPTIRLDLDLAPGVPVPGPGP